MTNVKTVIAFLVGCVAAFDQANADGKIDFNDLGALIPVGIQLPSLVSAAPLAFEEWKQASDEMRDAFVHQMNAELKFSKDLTHERIDAGLNILVYAGAFLKK